MPLDAVKCASAVELGCLMMSGYNPGDWTSDYEYETLRANIDASDYPSVWGSAYEAYGMDAAFYGATIPMADGTPIKAFHQACINGAYGSRHAIIDAWALAFVDFWSGVGTVGSFTPLPTKYGGIKIVRRTNNAADMYDAFYAAISNYIDQRSGILTEPFFLIFIQDIEAVVKTIVWTHVEEFPGPTGAPEEDFFSEMLL